MKLACSLQRIMEKRRSCLLAFVWTAHEAHVERAGNACRANAQVTIQNILYKGRHFLTVNKINKNMQE